MGTGSLGTNDNKRMPLIDWTILSMVRSCGIGLFGWNKDDQVGLTKAYRAAIGQLAASVTKGSSYMPQREIASRSEEEMNTIAEAIFQGLRKCLGEMDGLWGSTMEVYTNTMTIKQALLAPAVVATPSTGGSVGVISIDDEIEASG